MKATIYHNPRCTKSRQSLALLEELEADVTVVEYLKQPPDVDTLQSLLKKLKLPARDIVRSKEFSALNLDIDLDDDEAVIEALASHPQALQRPIIVIGRKACIGRPAENIHSIL